MTPYELFQMDKYGNILPEPEIEDQENNQVEISERQISIEIIELENL